MYFKVQNLTKIFIDKSLFRSLSFELHEGAVCGIVGQNGQGKTTLLKILANKMKADQGQISIHPLEAKLGYNEQFIDPDINGNQTIEEYILHSVGNIGTIYEYVKKLTSKTDSHSIEKLIELQSKFEEKGGYEIQRLIPQYLKGLGMDDIADESKISSLSGGQKTKLQLVKLLINNYDILLLDEPTNHLDTESIKWLENFIKQRKGISMIVSHDRNFLNNIANKILEIEDGKFWFYDGNYDSYKNKKENRLQKERQIYEAEMKHINRLKFSASQKLSEAKVTEKVVNTGWGADSIKRRAKKKVKVAKSYIKRIEKTIEEKLPDKQFKRDVVRFSIKNEYTSGNLVLKVQYVSFSYDKKEILNNVSFNIYKGERILLDGANGSGKTTLIKLILNQLKPSNGSITFGSNVITSYFAQEHDWLDPNNTVLSEFLKYNQMAQEDARTFLYKMLFGGDMVFQKISSLSQGEKSKLAYAIILSQNPNFLILDEPTNNLDIASREAIEISLGKYAGTILIVSHDKYFNEQLKINRIIEINKSVIS